MAKSNTVELTSADLQEGLGIESTSASGILRAMEDAGLAQCVGSARGRGYGKGRGRSLVYAVSTEDAKKFAKWIVESAGYAIQESASEEEGEAA